MYKSICKNSRKRNFFNDCFLVGGPVVPSGNMSSPTATTSAAAVAAVAVSSHHPMVPMVGYTTTGRPSTHQQQPMSFTRALEMTENIDQRPPAGAQTGARPPQQIAVSQAQPLDPQGSEDNRRDSVYDMNSYEISV